MFGTHRVIFVTITTVLIIHSSINEEQSCSELFHELFKCWASSSNVESCYHIPTKLRKVCPNEATKLYINKVIEIINKTDNVISSILTESEIPNHSCLSRIRSVGYAHGQFILNGYSKPDGCEYRKLLSVLAQLNNPHVNCTILTSKIEDALLSLSSDCSSNFRITDSESLQNSMIKCVELHSNVGICARQYSNCDKTTHASITKCFKDIVDNQTQCEEELLRRSVTHNAKTWENALKYYCSDRFVDEFRTFPRQLCKRPFYEITSKMAAVVPNFHSHQNCIDLQLYLNHTISLAIVDCREILTNYSNYLMSESDCLHSNSCTLYFSQYYFLTILIIIFQF